MECVQVRTVSSNSSMYSKAQLSFNSFKCRSARSPLKLVSRFADHPEIGTLHDNFVWATKFAWLTPHFPFIIKKIHHNFINYFPSFLFWFVCPVRRSVEAFPDCKYLGSRFREDGTIGEYVSPWKHVIELMTYLQSMLIQCIDETYSTGTDGCHMERQVLHGQQLVLP